MLCIFAILAYIYGYRRLRARRTNQRLSISCQGITTPVYLSSGKLVIPTVELSPYSSPERKI